MKYKTKVLALGLVFCVGLLPVGDMAAFAAAGPTTPESVKEQLNQYGVGASLKLKLLDGKTVKGSLASINEESFELKSKSEGSARLIAYNDVNAVRLARLVYRAKGAPDAIEARRVVIGLGVGHHIQVKTVGGKEYHGNIQAISADTFTLLPDHTTDPVEIAFSEASYVEQNMGTGTKVAIAVGIAVAFVLISILVALSRD